MTTKDEELRKELKDTADPVPYTDIIDFAARQLGEDPDEKWDLSTKEGLKRFEERCSRRVYKSTDCGAWLVFETQHPTETTLREFRVCLAAGKKGTEITQVRSGDDLLGEAEWPDEFKYFMSVSPYPGAEASFEPLSSMTLDRICEGTKPLAPAEEGHDILERRPSTLVLFVRVKCSRPKDMPMPKWGVYGIRLGSIVEGSDAEVDGGLLDFPFTQEQYEHAIEDMESECDRLWHEANDEPGTNECRECGVSLESKETDICASCAEEKQDERAQQQ